MGQERECVGLWGKSGTRESVCWVRLGQERERVWRESFGRDWVKRECVCVWGGIRVREWGESVR